MNMKVQTAIRKLAIALGFVLLAACGRPSACFDSAAAGCRGGRSRTRADPDAADSARNAPAGMLVLRRCGWVRDTVNAHLNPLEAVWNFRAAWNVAALNCLDARYQPILDATRCCLPSTRSG